MFYVIHLELMLEHILQGLTKYVLKDIAITIMGGGRHSFHLVTVQKCYWS